jgi:hypothetical protein
MHRKTGRDACHRQLAAVLVCTMAGAVAAPGLASAREPPYDVRPAIAAPS